MNFGVLGSLRLWGGGRWMGGIWGHGGVSTHMHMHAHARTCTHAHLYMYRNCKWPLTWKHPCLACLTCMCVCMHGTPPHTPMPTPVPIHPSATPPGVDPRNHLKFDNTSTYQDISIPFEDLKSVKNSLPMGGCVVWWVGGWVVGWVDGWVDGWGQVKSLKI